MFEVPEILQEQIGKAKVLVEALPYMQSFRGQTFLIKVGGSAMEDPQLVEQLMRDVVFLEAVGINPVLVHGGGKAISAAMQESGIEAEFVGGLRITDEASIKIVEETLGQRVNPDLVRMLKDAGGKAVGVSGREVFVADRIPDLGFVGTVAAVDPEKVLAFVAYDTVPVVTPLASEKGTRHALNVNADLAASALAGKLKAAKLVYLSDVLGVLRDPADPATLIPSITREDVERLIADEIISGGMIPKVRSASEAIGQGVGKIHMIDGRIRHSLLLEIFTNVGIGTEIIP